MKILMLTPYLPYPPSSGGQVRSYNLIRHLYKKHEITLFCYIRDDKERKYISKLKKYCKKVKVFKRRKAWSPVNLLLAGATPLPFLVCIYLSQKFRKSVAKELVQNKYDLIHAETFYVMTNIPATNLPTILVEQTIEYLVYQHFANSQKFWFLKPFLYIDVFKLKIWEKYFWGKADKVVAVSEEDKRQMLKLIPSLKVGLVPNGVNLDFFKPKDSWSLEEPKILFVANFKWLQNVEAANLLVDEVFPKILKADDQAKLWIVGQHIPASLEAKKSNNVLIDNLVESDEESIRRAYYEASVFVSPLRGPGGTRLKHFAAMASRLPLVTTSVGAEGLAAKDGVHLMVSDSPAGLAEKTIELLRNPQKSQTLAKNARKLVEEKFSWYKMSRFLDEIYAKYAK
ncbi:MAG: glycosyltransferase family 4 protein [Patescibacteria group bacterium]